MIIQYLILAFILFIVWRTGLRLKARDITGREFAAWLVLWLAVALATINPKQTDVVAAWLGVSRGADLLVYLSIIVIFFVVFKIIVKLENIDKTITKVVRETALKDVAKNKDLLDE